MFLNMSPSLAVFLILPNIISGLLSCDVSRVSIAASVVIRYPRGQNRLQTSLPNCELFIDGEKNKSIQLTLKSLVSPSSPDCADGALSFYLSSSSNQPIKQQCGIINARVVERFDTSQLRIQFQLHKRFPNAGFHIEYQLVPRPEPTTASPIQTGLSDQIPVNDESPACGNSQLPIWEDCTRITGGCAVRNGSWPWIASMSLDINDGETHFCAASLLSDRWLVSAAHCFRESVRSGAKAIDHQNDIVIRLGAYDLWRHAASEKDVGVEKVIVHDEYNLPVPFNNDIALIKLKYPVESSAAICPIRLPALYEEVASKTSVYVAGWGSDPLSPAPRDTLTHLYAARVPVVDQRSCRLIHKELMTDNMLCVGEPIGGVDACQGDSGGPLIRILPDSSKVLVGVVSWGKGCGERNNPGVYTRVANYVDWIENNMKDD